MENNTLKKTQNKTPENKNVEKKTSNKNSATDFQSIMLKLVTEHTESHESKNIKQKKWDKRFMDLALMVAKWSTCARPDRQVGSVIVKDNRVIATGYNGAPSGIMDCVERGYCIRERLNIASGTRAEICFSTHAEQNALVQAAKMGIAVDGGTVYVTHRPCVICTKLLINAGIKRIVYAFSYPDEFSVELLKQTGIELVHLNVSKE